MELLTHPFTIGLALGLAFALFIAISGWNKRRALRKDSRQLREHLHTQMTISSQGNQTLLLEVEQLKKQNENLRISLATMKNRPDKSELQTLYLYDKAIHLMYEKAPGFAPAWESTMKEAEIELDKMNTGVLAWVKKIIRPSLGSGRSQLNRPSESDTDIQVIKQENKSGHSN